MVRACENMQQFFPQKQRIEWPDNCHFFLTTSTFLHFPYFRDWPQKQLVLNKIKQIKQILQVKIESFSIQMNHLHLMFFADQGKKISKLKQILHGGVNREFNKKYQLKHKFAWQSSRTYFIVDDEMYWGVQGYIIGNLLKHKEVNTFQELYKDSFSSFRYIADKYGFDFACNLIRNVIYLEEDKDGIVKLADFSECGAVKPKRLTTVASNFTRE